MAIWTAVKAIVNGTPEFVGLSPALEGSDSLTDCIWNDAMVQNFVEDMSIPVNRGEANRAYERESSMQDLISASAQGVVILYGPSGSGKTALFEELSLRVVKGEIPTLLNWKILRLKLKQVKGDSSIEGKLDRVIDGGAASRFQMLFKYIQKKHAKGNDCIILIDEIQDLLESNIAIFDGHKEELGRSKFHIIGATTNKSIIDRLRNRGGSGVGMERRIGIVELQEMSHDETVKVLSQRAQSDPKFAVKFVFKSDFFQALVSLAKSKYPHKIFPDCAVSLFEDVKRFYLDQNAKLHLGGNATSSSSFVCTSLGSQEVIEYLSIVSKKPKEEIAHQVKSRAGLADRLFPLLKSPPSNSPWIESEAARLECFFRKFSENPFLFLRGESEAFLTQIITTYAQKKEVICCDVAQLIKHGNDAEGRQLIFQTLQRRIQDCSNSLLILKNYNPKRFSAPTKVATVAAKTEEIAYKVKNMPALQLLNQVSTTLGMGSLSSMVPTASETPLPPAQPSPLIEELFAFIEREKIPTVATLTSDTNAQRDSWSFFEVEPLTMDQTVQWLESQFPNKQPQILPILAAFYYLKDPALPHSVIDLTSQTLTTVENDSGSDPAKAMLEVLGGVKPLKEIQSALESASIAMFEQPWSELSGQEILSQNQTFPDVPPGTVLWIAENSSHRRQWLSLQMASQMKSLKCYWYESSPAWREIPQPLKEQLLHKFFRTDHVKTDKVLFVSEADLKDATLQKVLQKGTCRVVGFYSPKSTVPAQTINSSAPLMNPLMEQGKTLLKELMVPQQTPSIQPPIPELGLKALYYNLPALTVQEKKQIVSHICEGISAEAMSYILPLYLLLDEKTDSFDETLQCLEQDLNLLKASSTDQIDLQFTQLYGKELKMSLQDIRYIIDPKLCSPEYRFQRLVKSSLANGLSLILAPFRWAASRLVHTIMNFIGDWILSKIAPKARPS